MVMKRLGWMLALLLGMTPVTRAADAHFVASEVTVHGHRYPFQVFVPRNWSADRAWPVVLFLHGSGERGNDNEAQLRQGLPPWLKEHGGDFPAVMVAPQAPADTVWSGEVERAAMAALEQSIKTYHGDRTRLYVTGLSMGGYGAWQAAVDHPGMFAAAVVICGGIRSLDDMPELKVYGVPGGVDPYAWVADRVKPMPVWIFHGAIDDQVPPEESRAMNKALLKVGDPVRYTEYPGVGHGSWGRAYDTSELWPWVFSHRTGSAG
jgi:predicted peptidase